MERRSGKDGREWARVALPDYSGWVRSEDLALEPGIAITAPANGRVVMVIAPSATIETRRGPFTVYAGTALRLGGASGVHTMEVLLPGDNRGLINTNDVRSLEAEVAHNEASVNSAIVATAHGFLDTPYLWGGMTNKGIDCSGFVQTVYRVHGYTMPRDAHDQFAALEQQVERENLEPGDLIYLGVTPDKITHVGMFIGDNKVIHASGGATVVVQSLDSNDENYAPRFIEKYQGARRVV